jgi:iron-sulfur cluster repair protein YtfE (RIC family)
MANTDTKKTPFEQVRREHDEFKAMIASIREFVEHPRPGVGDPEGHSWAVDLSKLLVSLHDKLVGHFHHEEQGGLFETLADREPGSIRQIESLKGEHGEILGQVRELMTGALTYSEGAPGDDPHLRQRVTVVLDRLGDHEMAETELMQTVEYRDLGTGD